MKRLFIVVSLVLFTLTANGSYKLGLNTQAALTTTKDIFSDCSEVSDREYCVLYALGYLGYYTDKNTPDMDNFLKDNQDLFTGSEQVMVERLNRFHATMVEDEDIGLEEAEYICTIAGAIGALYYAITIEKNLNVDDASKWAVDSCKLGVAPFNISMYALDSISYLSRL